LKQSSPRKVGTRAEIASHTIDSRVYIHCSRSFVTETRTSDVCTVHNRRTCATRRAGTVESGEAAAEMETETEHKFTILDRDRNACK